MTDKRRYRAVKGLAASVSIAALAAAAGCATAHHRSPESAVTTTVAPTTSTPTAPTSATARSITTTSEPMATSTTPPTTTAVASQTNPCQSNLPEHLASTRGAAQLITVEASEYATTYASLTAWQKTGSCWQLAAGPWTARIGENGFSDHHREGDGTTPTGIYGIGPTMYGNQPSPGVRYAYHQLVCGDWWDEDPLSAEYNTFQHVPCGETPAFAEGPEGAGSEALWTETVAYPSFAVIEYNTDPVVPYAGSAIFLPAQTGYPTVGCVSLPSSDLDQLLRWLNPAASPRVVMGPSSEIASF